ncbi:lipase family protein [Geobacter sp. DSM 9736]|uniref:alpha/beta hydrolase n=1 Tax=Geobacter sp. DSM 9736 TaxID=1277350 RepID=UPI000B5EF171|nr:lipase family protein [Geobacter sp. DSM 9736]SNB46304.1 Prolyl oligopeptidase family protein [Geobacter sp. DSM 9736]
MTFILSLLILFFGVPAVHADRGELVSSRLRQHLTAPEAAAAAYPAGRVNSACPVDLYVLVYRTLDGKGKEVSASGAVAVPVGSPPVPVVSIQHGTVFGKDDVPSRLPVHLLADGIVFAASGYLAVMPDYVGYGESSASFHPYLHARSLAASIVDMLKAARTFSERKGVRTDGRLFLTGYSEGGYATLAAHREIEERHPGEFRVAASAPMAGPYDLMLTLDLLMRRGSSGSVPYLAFAFGAYDRIYGFGRLRGIIRDPYRSRVLRLLDGPQSGKAFDSALPDKGGAQLFEPAFLSGWKGRGAKRVKAAARENSLTSWKPEAPVAFFHCKRDSLVPVENAKAARASFKARGAADVRLVERDLGDHGSCFAPLLAEARSFFDSFGGGGE